MEPKEIESFLIDNELDSPRYYCNLDNVWFLLIVNKKLNTKNYSLCLVLNNIELINPPVNTIYFIKIDLNSNKPQCNSLIVSAMIRQLDRLQDETALISDNIIVLKMGTNIIAGYTNGYIDTSKIYSIETYKSPLSFDRSMLEKDKEEQISLLKQQMSQQWCDETMYAIHEKIMNRIDRRQGILKLKAIVSMEANEEDLILMERFSFEACLASEINKYFINNLENLSNKSL